MSTKNVKRVKGRKKSMNAVFEQTNVVDFKSNKAKENKKKGIRKAIPFSQMSEEARIETIKAMKDED